MEEKNNIPVGPSTPKVVKFSDLGPNSPQHIAIIMDGNGRWATER